MAVTALGTLICADGAFGEELKFTSADQSRLEYDRTFKPLVLKSCGKCHGAKVAEGKLNLLALDPDMKSSTSAARWAMVVEKIVAREMPPKEGTPLSDEELKTLTGWISAEMKRSGKHLSRREAYNNGNKIPHHMLFDPQQNGRFEVVAGVRRLSPEIYSAVSRELAKDVSDIGQPFSPEGRYTFKDMGAPKLDEPTTAQLIRNALLIVERRLTAHKMEGGVIKAAQQGTQKQFLRLLDNANPPTDAEIDAAIKLMFQLALRREPSGEELKRFAEFYARNVKDAGRVTGANYTLAAVLLIPEAVFRLELGGGVPDAAGRIRLAPREIAFAVAYGLTDRRPDSILLAAAATGELDTDEGVRKQVQRLLDDAKIEKPRILRFFREYFGYDKATEVFKEDKDNPEHEARILVEDTDRLVLFLLEQDREVLRELLTTNKSFVAYKSATDMKKRRAEELAKFADQKAKEPEKFATKKPPKVGRSVYEAYGLTDFPDVQPVELPASERAGILTQPSWLVAHSTSTDNHAIHRGKWVRERLLGGVVPDIPITVDAQLPIAPEKTLRERMSVTKQDYCWQCHRLMNDVGLPFERYDHFGRFRSAELVLDPGATALNVDKKNKPLGPVTRGAALDTTGRIAHASDAKLEGEIADAVPMMHKLASSERVEQVFVRHAFRYFLGRNETPGDAASLQGVHKAYRASGGSMKALIAALLTSESFIYRVASGGPTVGPNAKAVP